MGEGVKDITEFEPKDERERGAAAVAVMRDREDQLAAAGLAGLTPFDLLLVEVAYAHGSGHVQQIVREQIGPAAATVNGQQVVRAALASRPLSLTGRPDAMPADRRGGPAKDGGGSGQDLHLRRRSRRRAHGRLRARARLMKVYVGATFSRYLEVRAIIDALAEMGHEVTHDWTRTDAFGPDGHPLPGTDGGYDLDPSDGARHALDDLRAIAEAEVVLALGQQPSCGWPIEVGMAIAMGRAVLVVAPFKYTVFWDLPNVAVHDTVDLALADLAGISAAAGGASDLADVGLANAGAEVILTSPAWRGPA